MKRTRPKAAIAFTVITVCLAGIITVYAKEPAREPVKTTKTQAPEPGTTQYFGSWGISCNDVQGQKMCTLAQELRRKEDNARLTLFEVRPNSPSQATAGLTLPFGLNVHTGISLQIDNGPVVQNVAYSSCFKQGCIVPMNLDERALNALRQGKVLKISAPVVSGGMANFELPLTGLAEAYAAMLELAARR